MNLSPVVLAGDGVLRVPLTPDMGIDICEGASSFQRFGRN